MRATWIEARVIVVAAGAMFLAACLAPDGQCDEENCESIASGVIQPCESFGCGGNAGIRGTLFHELRAALPNEEGIVIVGARSGAGAAHRVPVGTPMDLDVQAYSLVGLVAGQPAVEGVELGGSMIHLRLASGTSVIVHIKSIGVTEFWTGDAAGPEQATVYGFNWQVGVNLPELSTNADGWLPLCARSPYEPIPRPEEPTIGSDFLTSSNLAVVFGGDRYDADGITVEVPGEAGWFNISCVGTALAKMHLLRHTSAGSGTTGSPSVEQRQAMLKLLSADYCGDGHAYARNGTPLFFQDQDGRFDPTPWWGDRVAGPEAIWTSAGALCLDDPRRWDPTQSHADLRAEIVAACESSPVESLRRTIPRCTEDQLASWQSSGHISRNVDPP
jgi:ADYC domain